MSEVERLKREIRERMVRVPRSVVNGGAAQAAAYKDLIAKAQATLRKSSPKLESIRAINNALASYGS